MNKPERLFLLGKQADDKGGFVLAARVSRANLSQTPSRYFNRI